MADDKTTSASADGASPAQNSSQGKIPRHVAMIMDGNGRWAKKRNQPRIMGHRAGVEAVRGVVSGCAKQGIEVLTLFAFSSENWRRPEDEVDGLMVLFLESLQQEIDELDAEGVQIRFIGDLSRFSVQLKAQMKESVKRTENNHALVFAVAVNYGGQWDIANAAQEIAKKVEQKRLKADQVTESLFAEYMSLGDLPPPDLCIRTGGDSRISNFLLWQLAYAELYFTECYWPDFSADQLSAAIAEYQRRQRRFGRTAEQVEANMSAKDSSTC